MFKILYLLNDHYFTKFYYFHDYDLLLLYEAINTTDHPRGKFVNVKFVYGNRISAETSDVCFLWPNSSFVVYLMISN